VKRDCIKVGVIRIEGTNCEQESLDAFKRLGVNVEFVHLKQLLGIDSNKDEKRDIFDYHCLMIPGGFSAGDYIRAGAIFAARIKSKLQAELKRFVDEHYPVLGICNGFQVLIELGLLPGINNHISDMPEAALYINESDRFECRPTLLKHENKGNCLFTSRIPQHDIRLIPSAHAEGRLMFPQSQQDKIVKILDKNDQIVFRYVDPNGEYGDYPWNPNGSIDNIAGICNSEGNVFGLMPHPERTFYRIQHPNWPRSKLGDNVGDGQAIFDSVISYLEKKM
jgi:phosphoribosylformylglycinamidine synthase